MKLKKLNLDAQANGVTVDLGDNSSVTLRSTASKQYTDYIQQRLKPYKASLKSKSLGDEALAKIFEGITADALADIVVINWSGIQDENGVDIPYSKEKAHEIFTDPAYAEFKELVGGLAAENETFRTVVDGVVKN